MDIKPFLKQLRQLCRENIVAMLGVFGSVARGEDTPKSDVDRLVRFAKTPDLIKFIQLEDKFMNLLGRKLISVTKTPCIL